MARQKMVKLVRVTKEGRFITREDDPLVPLGLDAPTEFHRKLAKQLIRSRAEHALEEEEELDRQVEAWFEERRHIGSARNQIDAGKRSPGRRGKYKTPRDQLRAEVQAMHERFPRLTYNAVCNKVGKSFGYDSGWPAKQAAADLKWPDPRRKK